jgi:aldehyde dehydrogenase (NAD+)
VKAGMSESGAAQSGAGELQFEAAGVLAELGLQEPLRHGDLDVRSPITGEAVAQIHKTDPTGAEQSIAGAREAFLAWRTVPAPRRGELVRRFGEELRRAKPALARLITIETGKIVTESLGEVQEMIDICDFAVGLSRQLHGLTFASERPGHRMMESWHPFGVVGVITSFNFPAAVWAWNAALALACGNSILWKPSEKTPLTAMATQALLMRAAERAGDVPPGLSSLLIGGRELGALLADDPRVGIVSATGSTAMGRALAPRLAGRFARAILELGGNNAAIVCPSASLELAARAIAFAAMGTAGQRCTTLRRLIVHEEIYDKLLTRIRGAYDSISVGDPREADTLVGPLIDRQAYQAMRQALDEARLDGGLTRGGERLHAERFPGAYYVRPALVELAEQTSVMRRETFAPILYVIAYRDFNAAVAVHNDVPQGLASSIFTNDLREAESFLTGAGSDCGIANVNVGPSGAEIGGAFGGEKESGGGREAGSDSWKAYMRRATNAINFSNDLPLAQGVQFTV